MLDNLFCRSHLIYVVPRICITKEKIGGKGYSITQTSPEYFRYRNAPPLSNYVQTSKFQCGENLSTIVIKRRGWVGDQKPQLLKPRGVVSNQILLHRTNARLGGLATTTHFSQTNQTFVGFYFDNRPHKPTPVAAVCMAQWCFEWDGYCGWSDVDDLHVRENLSV